MVDNFLSDARHCEFYTIGCWIILYPYEYFELCSGTQFNYLEFKILDHVFKILLDETKAELDLGLSILIIEARSFSVLYSKAMN